MFVVLFVCFVIQAETDNRLTVISAANNQIVIVEHHFVSLFMVGKYVIQNSFWCINYWRHFTMNSEERKTYNKEYRKNNKERILETEKKYRLRNKERIRENQHNFYLCNKEKRIKNNKAWRNNNLTQCNERQKQSKAKARVFNKEFSIFVKSYFGCQDCQIKDYRVLQFHHLDPKLKKYNITSIVGSGYTIKTIKEEMKKCIVLCSNCHILRHYTD
jgi:hypothetical protein